VKQGGVFLSRPLLYMYTDNLLVRFSKSSSCCYTGNTFVEALAYADDIMLVTPSVSAIRICWVYVMTSLQSTVSRLTQPNLNVWLHPVYSSYCAIPWVL